MGLPSTQEWEIIDTEIIAIYARMRIHEKCTVSQVPFFVARRTEIESLSNLQKNNFLLT